MKNFEKNEDVEEKGVLNSRAPKRSLTTVGTDSDLSQISSGWLGFLDDSLSLMSAFQDDRK